MTAALRWQVARGAAAADPAGPGAAPEPCPPPDADWYDAVVPGSLAASPSVVAALGEQALAEADHATWWWRGRTRLDAVLEEPELVLDGLATHADVWVDGAHVLRSDDAWLRHVVRLPALGPGEHEVVIRVGSWEDNPMSRKPRARWRSALLPDSSLRRRRTPLLGRIPTWEGALPPVGVLGEATLRARPTVEVTAVRTALEGARGVVLVDLVADDERPAAVELAGTRVPVSWHPAGTAEAEAGAAAVARSQASPGGAAADPGLPAARPVGHQEDGRVRGSARLELDHVEPWWPHTHGRPTLHRLRVEAGGETVLERPVGFARVEARREDGRFALLVNDVPVFVRGAVWAATDPRGWTSDPDAVGRDLDALVAAGIDLVRVPGTGSYADEVLRRACAERGLLVWQDAALATFDPPEDETWLAGLEAELRDQLSRWQGWPHLAVVCGGTETEQQPTLMGLPAQDRRMTAIHELLPRVAAEVVPGAVHVTSSPSGGPRPVSIDQGVSHYFGVGAYLRPLEDARTARVSFASEALAFAVPPERSSMGQAPADRGPGSAWRSAAPHDRGTAWDFVDVTDHYVPDVADPDRAAHDRQDQQAWEDLERLAATRAVVDTFCAWRSGLTPTAGGVVLAHRDLAPGPGWGLLDAGGAPKAPLLALADVLAPTALLLVDRGLDGLLLEAVVDGPEPVTGTLRLWAQDRHGTTALETTTELSVPARGRTCVEVEEVLGGFRDLGWAWRFAPEPAWSVVGATWRTPAGVVRAARALCPVGAAASEPDVTARAVLCDGVVEVEVTATGPGVQGVHALAPGWVADTGWWPLPYEDTRTIRLRSYDAPPPARVRVATVTGASLDVPVETGAARD